MAVVLCHKNKIDSYCTDAWTVENAVSCMEGETFQLELNEINDTAALVLMNVG